MYEAFFGFHQRPFTAAPLANCYFPAASVDASRQAIARCLERGAGAALVIGAPGLGKSLLLQVLAGHFADKMVVVALAGAQLLTRRELLQAILFELQLPYRGLEEGELRLALVDHLTRGDKCPQGILLLVDEAQSLPTLLLEELRMMTNLARGGDAKVRLVLAGSMELEEIFARPELQAFSQRLAARCYLEPFDRAETIDYLRFQVAVAGGQAERVFGGSALDAVYRASDGIPRLVNQLCDHALMLAYQAERRPLEAKDIEIAWADLQQLPSPWQQERSAEDDAAGPTLEFGTLVEDDIPTEDASPLRLASLPREAATIWPSEASGHDAGDEQIDLDFSSDWAAEAALPIQVQGLRIVEDSERLQIVVDPYDSLHDDHDESDNEESDNEESDNEESGDCDDPVQTSAQATAPQFAAKMAQPLNAASAPSFAPSAGRSQLPNVWEDVIIPVEPLGWSRMPPAEQAAFGRLVRQAAGDVDPAHAAGPPPASASSNNELLDEEVVADRYAQLDALQPRASVSVAEAAPRLADQRVKSTGPGTDGRLTLSEAIRLRTEAEAAAAAAHGLVERDGGLLGDAPLHSLIARLPASPTADRRLSDSATLVLDPTQLPPSAVIHVSAPDLTSDIVVIDEAPATPAPSPNESLHRVERKDYKSLFAQLRRG